MSHCCFLLSEMNLKLLKPAKSNLTGCSVVWEVKRDYSNKALRIIMFCYD